MKKSFFNQKGKRHRYLYFIFCGIILGSFFGALINNVVSALPVNWNELDDFDNNVIGATSGVNGIFSWEKTGGTNFEIRGSADPGGDKYLEVKHDGYGGSGFFNTTTSYAGFYIGFYEYSLILVTIDFYNASDGVCVTLRVYQDGPNQYFQYRDDGGTYHNVGSYLTASGGTYYISWEFLTDNVIQYKIYDSSFNLLTRVNDTAISGEVGQDNYNCSYAYISCGDYGSTPDFYIYYYGYITPSYEPGTFIPDSSLGSRCANPHNDYTQLCTLTSQYSIDWLCILTHPPWMWSMCVNGLSYDLVPVSYVEHETEGYYSERVRHVLLPVSIEQLNLVSNDPDDYSLMLNGNYCGSADYIVIYDEQYAIVWENINIIISDSKEVFAFYCSKHTTGYNQDWYWYGLGGYYGGWGTTRGHNSGSYFADGILDGSFIGNFKLGVCWYYDQSSTVSETEPWEIPIINDFDDVFGDGDEGFGYVEFYGWNSNCYYIYGNENHPVTIVYNLTGYGPGNGTKTYYYNINKITSNGSNDLIVYNDFIEVSDANYSRHVLDISDSFSFPSGGRYYINVWNTSDYGTSLEEFVHRSVTITVCSGTTPVTPEPELTPFLPNIGGTTLGWIIGFCIILAFGLAPIGISAGFHVDVPIMVYVLFAGIGMAFSIAIGYIAWWVAFFIIALLVCIIIIEYLRGSGAGSGT